MKRLTGLILILVMLMAAVPACVYGATPEPRIDAKAAILVDMNSGEVLYEKSADERNYPASTTKMMTCILGLENLQPDAVITADSEAAAARGTTIDLKDGEMMPVDTILHAMMVPSANDCAIAIGKAVAGSVDNFAVTMNAKAKEIGCEHTNFVNPNGLHDENHYSTARDLSLIAQYCMKNEAFREIVQNYEYTVPATNKSSERHLNTTNLLLNDTQDKNRIYVGSQLRYCKYDGTYGIKTGYTGAAGGCLVSACKRGDTNLLCVVLGSSDLGRFADSIKLYEWGFEN
ncbi:MAG: D-alanyl-D-alanine carboxypeptidase, partial [Clostridia bacterium]|nr:D-alanyl-D-alanine carboxypeptidase [Clostridia bacterium]